MNDLPLYRRADVELPKYLIVYQIVTDDLEGVFKEVSRRLQTGETKMDPSFDRATSVSYTYRAFRPFVKGIGGEPRGVTPGKKELYAHVVFTPFVDGKEDEFNAVYDNYHAPELAAIPGFTGAQRMILARPDTASVKGTKYLALFVVETSNLAAVKERNQRSGDAEPRPGSRRYARVYIPRDRAGGSRRPPYGPIARDHPESEPSARVALVPDEGSAGRRHHGHHFHREPHAALHHRHRAHGPRALSRRNGRSWHLASAKPLPVSIGMPCWFWRIQCPVSSRSSTTGTPTRTWATSSNFLGGRALSASASCRA